MRDIAAERAEIDREIEGLTLCRVFAGTVERLGDAEALVVGSGAARRSWTWKMYREQVREVALGLRELGFARGAFALVLARNRPEHVIGDLGVVHAGGTPVSAYTTLAGEQLAYIANHCEAKVVIVEDRGFADKVAALRGQLPHLERVVIIEGGAAQPWEIAWDQLLATGRAAHARTPAAFDAMWREVAPDDTLTLIYTSGTTGHPKGVIDTHRNALWDMTAQRRMVATTEHDRVISYLPLAHAADRFLAYYQSVVGGHTLHFCPDLTQILALLTEVRPTFFGSVPRIWEKLHAGMLAALASEPDEQRRRMVLGALEVGRAVVACEQRGEPVPDDVRTKRAAVEPIFAAIRARVGLDQVRCTVTGAARAAHAEEQEDLVAGIGERVDRLRQHGGGLRRERGDELRDRDADVCRERLDDDAGGPTRHGRLLGSRAHRRRALVVAELLALDRYRARRGVLAARAVGGLGVGDHLRAGIGARLWSRAAAGGLRAGIATAGRRGGGRLLRATGSECEREHERDGGKAVHARNVAQQRLTAWPRARDSTARLPTARP